MFSRILHLCPKERESSRRWREPLPHGRDPSRAPQRKDLIGVHTAGKPVSLGPLYLTI